MKVWDSEHRETVNKYDADHNLLAVQERITDKEWRKNLHQYDQMGRRVSTWDSLGNETKFQYEANRAYPSRVLTPKNEETVYEYDKVGRRMSVGNSYGTVMLSYNSRNFVTKRVDGGGLYQQVVLRPNGESDVILSGRELEETGGDTNIIMTSLNIYCGYRLTRE